jgi:hypothetical protein
MSSAKVDHLVRVDAGMFRDLDVHDSPALLREQDERTALGLLSGPPRRNPSTSAWRHVRPHL